MRFQVPGSDSQHSNANVVKGWNKGIRNVPGMYDVCLKDNFWTLQCDKEAIFWLQ